jgi:hypothetical protein
MSATPPLSTRALSRSVLAAEERTGSFENVSLDAGRDHVRCDTDLMKPKCTPVAF